MNYRSIFSALAAGIVLSSCGAPNGVLSERSGLASHVARHGTNSTLPTLYILNLWNRTDDGWVDAYSDAGATFARRFGKITGDGPVDTSMTADASGHLYLFPGSPFSQLLVYKNYGAGILQTLLYKKKTIFTSLTLDDSGNLFAEVRNVKKFAGHLYEFPADRDGSLKLKPFIRNDVFPYSIATDTIGDVGVANGLGGFAVFTKKSKSPFWILKEHDTNYPVSAFDPSDNLFVAQSSGSSEPTSISVYARGASTPTYTISTGIYTPTQLLFDASGNLYVAESCYSKCGSNPSSTVAIYAPSATSPRTTITPPPAITSAKSVLAAAVILRPSSIIQARLTVRWLSMLPAPPYPPRPYPPAFKVRPKSFSETRPRRILLIWQQLRLQRPRRDRALGCVV